MKLYDLKKISELPTSIKNKYEKVKRGFQLSNLKHIQKDVADSDAKIYILDRGEKIDAESEAMLQALHSRSTGGLIHHLNELKKRGSQNFMKTFYSGYGHKSIADCGDTTMFVEGVSMLVAKAIQDNPLYSGQESSTRYLNFANQKFINPLNSKKGDKILEGSRDFYLSIKEPIVEYLKQLNPFDGEDKDYQTYLKAINARAFDISRAFLPAGTSTNLAWHSNLRQIDDKLLFLRHHPLEEVRNVANSLEEGLMEKFPNTFVGKRYKETEDYQDLISKNYYYHNPNIKEGIFIKDSIDREALINYSELIDKRPQKTKLPKYMSELGDISVEMTLDFGSYRDLQRHRPLNQRMPLLTTDLGFNKWYLENLPEDVRVKAKSHLKNIESSINDLNCCDELKQYYIPMGYNILSKFRGDLPSMIYMGELRNTRFVHPTLRERAITICDYMQDNLGVGVHMDKSPHEFDIKRGEHDIVLRD